MKDPERVIEEPCEFCGHPPLVRWYDCCCEKQQQLYIQERKQWKIFLAQEDCEAPGIGDS